METQETLRLISQALYSSLETQKNSFELAREVVSRKIDGDIVECGIAAGGNFASMLLGIKSMGEKRKSWGFDSFQGIQLAGKKDTVQAGIGKITHDVNVPEQELLKSSGITVHPKEQVIKNLKRWGLYDDYVNLIEGWVQNTIPTVIDKIDKISILRLDMDVYSPTKFTLEYLYPKVSVGGVVVIDDWELDGARLACHEYFEENGIKPEILSIPNSTPKYFYKN